MSIATIEHINISVANAAATARRLCRLFDWKIRWHGRSMQGGTTYHVGTDRHYLAVYTNDDIQPLKGRNHAQIANLNHVGIVVDDLEEVEKRVKRAGFTPHNHGDYEPGRRFYFHDDDGIEFEVVSYQPQNKMSFTRMLGEMSYNGAMRK